MKLRVTFKILRGLTQVLCANFASSDRLLDDFEFKSYLFYEFFKRTLEELLILYQSYGSKRFLAIKTTKFYCFCLVVWLCNVDF